LRESPEGFDTASRVSSDGRAEHYAPPGRPGFREGDLTMNPYGAVRISDHVYWVGAVDWRVRDFHGYATHRGTTYNAYLVVADKITLVDTVKKPFKDELLSRIASVVDPAEVSYVISNHSEMDHSGCLPEVVEMVRPERVMASVMGSKALNDHFGIGGLVTPVKDGEAVSLGDMNFTFAETKMVHWPDSMVAYLANDGVLFSQDGFGMHLATTARFADEVEDWLLDTEAAKYYANILLPLSPLVRKVLERIQNLGIDIKVLAPDHGPIWRKNIERIIGLYASWAERRPSERAVVVYDTMWGSTEKMAEAVVEGLVAGGVTASLMPLKSCHRSDVATELLGAGALMVGSPTMNRNLFPTVADVLTYLKGLKAATPLGAAFGSYGWSGEAVAQVAGMLAEIGITELLDSVRAKYVPKPEDIGSCHSLGVDAARGLKEVCGRGER
jgi:flavorubredoxin